MFVETIPNRGSPPAILLRESWRDEEGRTHKRTLANLSKLPADLLEGLKALLKGSTVIGTGADAIERHEPEPGNSVLFDVNDNSALGSLLAGLKAASLKIPGIDNPRSSLAQGFTFMDMT